MCCMVKLLVLLAGLLFSTASLGASLPTIGIVTYRLDARVGDLSGYEAPLASAINANVLIREALPHEFCFEDEESATLARISHAGSEVQAVKALVAEGVDAIVLTPAPYAEMLRPDIDALAAQLPIVVTMRRIPGLDLPYYGFDAFELGRAWVESKDSSSSRPFAVIGYFSDPMQAEFLEGLKTSPDFRGSYEVRFGGGQMEASDAILDIPDLAAIIVTEPAYVPGVAEIVLYAATELGQPLIMGSLGLPQGWEDLFAKGLLRAAISWDTYELLLQAATAAKEALLQGETPVGRPIDLLFYAPDATGVLLPYPYDDVRTLGRFWQ